MIREQATETSAPSKEACLRCYYFVTITLPKLEKPSGLCHRHPPTVHVDPKWGELLSCYPIVLERDWCGEWKRRPAEERRNLATRPLVPPAT